MDLKLIGCLLRIMDKSLLNLRRELGKIYDPEHTNYKAIGAFTRDDDNTTDISPNGQLQQYLQTTGIDKWCWKTPDSVVFDSPDWQQTGTCFCHNKCLIENCVIVHKNNPHRGFLIGNNCIRRFGITIEPKTCINDGCDNVRRESSANDNQCSSCRNQQKKNEKTRQKELQKLRKNPRQFLYNYVNSKHVDFYIEKEIEAKIKHVWFHINDKNLAKEQGGVWDSFKKKWCYLYGYMKELIYEKK